MALIDDVENVKDFDMLSISTSLQMEFIMQQGYDKI